MGATLEFFITPRGGLVNINEEISFTAQRYTQEPHGIRNKTHTYTQNIEDALSLDLGLFGFESQTMLYIESHQMYSAYDLSISPSRCFHLPDEKNCRPQGNVFADALVFGIPVELQKRPRELLFQT